MKKSRFAPVMHASPRQRRRALTLLVIGCLMLSAIAYFAHIAPVSAQSGDLFDLTWNSIDSGGGISTGGGYTLCGTIGELGAGTAGDGAFTLDSGFCAANTGGSTYLPLLRR